MIKTIKISLLIVFIVSCKQYDDSRLNIYGYAISDSLSNDFALIDTGSFHSSARAQYIDDSRYEVATINNIIYSMTFSSVSKDEYLSIKKRIAELIASPPIHSRGITRSGVKIVGDELFWFDSVSADEIVIGIDYRKDSSYFVWIHNSILQDSLLWLYVPNYDTTDIELELIQF